MSKNDVEGNKADIAEHVTELAVIIGSIFASPMAAVLLPFAGLAVGMTRTIKEHQSISRLNNLASIILHRNKSIQEAERILRENPDDAATIVNNLLTDDEDGKARIYARLLLAIGEGRLPEPDQRTIFMRIVKDLTSAQLQLNKEIYIYLIRTSREAQRRQKNPLLNMVRFHRQTLEKTGLISEGEVAKQQGSSLSITETGRHLVEILWTHEELSPGTQNERVSRQGKIQILGDLDNLPTGLDRKLLASLEAAGIASTLCAFNLVRRGTYPVGRSMAILIGPNTEFDTALIARLNAVTQGSRLVIIAHYESDNRQGVNLGLLNVTHEVAITMENLSDVLNGLLVDLL